MGLGKILAAFFGAVVLLLLFMGALVHTTLADKQEAAGSVRPSDLLRILVRHVQAIPYLLL
jgi:hypothetical protein